MSDVPIAYAGLIDSSEELASAMAARQASLHNIAAAKDLYEQLTMQHSAIESRYIDATAEFYRQERLYEAR